VIHPAKSPPKVRTVDNKANLLNADPPAMASRGDVTKQLSMRNEFRSENDKAITDLKRDFAMAGEPAPLALSQGLPEVLTEDDKAKPLKESFPLTNSIASAKEQPSVRDEIRHADKELKALSPVAHPLPEKPVHLLPTEPPYSGSTQDALGTVKESSLGKIERQNAGIHHKDLPAGEMKHTGAIEKTLFAFKEKAMTSISAVAASVRKKSAIRPEIIKPVKLALKSLSIVLSCLVILFLYRENKSARQRYTEQTEHPPAINGAFD